MLNYNENPHIEWGQGENYAPKPPERGLPKSAGADEESPRNGGLLAAEESPRNGGLGAGAAGGASEFPLSAFSTNVRYLIEEVCRLNRFKPDYFVTALISAAATAVGNSRWLRVQGNWTVAPSIYAVLVGAPGMGKTPPLKAAFEPLRRWDETVLNFHLSEWAKHKAHPEENPKPILQETILDDFTLESLARAHTNNPRGVTIINDEVSQLFTSAQRYNAAPLVTQLLSAWSGSPLKYNRVSQEVPLVIDQPCVGLIGTTQTAMFEKFITSGNCRDNGFLDRMLIAYPAHQELEKWEESSADEREHLEEMTRVFHEGMERLIHLDRQYEDPCMMVWSPEAERLFIANHNRMVEQLRELDPDAMDSRLMKTDNHIARLALVIECIDWAWRGFISGACSTTVSEQTLRAAMALMSYYDNCYERLMARISEADEEARKREPDRVSLTDERRRQMLKMLNPEFSTDEAIAAGAMLGISHATVSRELASMIRSGLIVRVRHGRYMMVPQEPEQND